MAVAGKLNDPAVLDQPGPPHAGRSQREALVNNFAAQWLYLRNLKISAPDPKTFPISTTTCARLCAPKPKCSFDSIVHEDRNVLDLLNADYTFVNERLAQHYGIPDVYGAALPPRDAHRRCAPRVAGAGSILTVTSYRYPHFAGAARQMDTENILGRRRPRRRPTCRR